MHTHSDRIEHNGGIARLLKRALLNIALVATAAGATINASADEANWYPSKYGADDEIGSLNMLSAAKVKQAAKLIKTGKTYSLGVVTGSKSPAYPPRQYSMTILQLDDGMGTPLGTNRATGNDDLMNMWMGIGSQIDGLGHMGVDHVYYNGNKASDFVHPTGLKKMGTHKLPPMVTRGVLLDMTAHFGKPMLAPGTAFNSADIKAAAKAQRIKIRKGDVVLFHTGWLTKSDTAPVEFMAGEPGLGLDGAQYLASLDVMAVGADTWGLEVLPAEIEGELFPVHPELLAKNGIYILENMNTHELQADEAWEFMFVLGQPKFEGAVQAVINPVAIR